MISADKKVSPTILSITGEEAVSLPSNTLGVFEVWSSLVDKLAIKTEWTNMSLDAVFSPLWCCHGSKHWTPKCNV